MDSITITQQLTNFAHVHQMANKGALCVALVVSRFARNNGLPINSEDLLTNRQGQVKGLGKSNVQSILKDYGITRVLAEEGGRTSRGSIGNMQSYVAFLNKGQYSRQQMEEIEAWWVDQIRKFFAGKPMVLRIDAGKSMREAVRELMRQAEKRQEEQPGNHVVGTVMQHLVGAKLTLLLENPPEMHGASVADTVSDRDGDFIVEDVVIHVTSAPSEALIRKCGRNLEKGVRPIIITTYHGVLAAEQLAKNAAIAERIDIFDIEQFVASNLYEIGKFTGTGRRNTADELIKAYNAIVLQCETDPSLQITVGR